MTLTLLVQDQISFFVNWGLPGELLEQLEMLNQSQNGTGRQQGDFS